MKKFIQISIALISLSWVGHSFAGGVKLGEGKLVSLSSGDTLYSGSNSTTSVSFGRTGTQPELKALAESLALLSQDANGVFNASKFISQAYVYVKSEIKPEFRFGLSKGALGAFIDKSGTPFDQTQLLHDILVAKSIGSSYILGKATLTATQFNDWAGITTAKEACKLFANGGIPAAINGSSPADCNISGAVDSVTFSHIWLSVEGGGQTFLLDPSFKKITYTNPVNLIADTGYSRSALLTSVTTTVSQPRYYNGVLQPDNGTGTPTGLNSSGLTSKLNQLASTYYQKAKTDYSQLSTKAIFGGAELTQKEFVPVANELVALPYQSSVVTTLSSVPDKLRTKLTIAYLNSYQDQTPVKSFVFFADNTYGGLISFSPNQHPYGSSISNTSCVMSFDGNTIDTTVFRARPISISIDHPYLAGNDSGTANAFQDSTSMFLLNCILPAQFMQGYGFAGDGLAKVYKEKILEKRATVSIAGPYSGTYLVNDVSWGWSSITSAVGGYLNEQSKRVEMLGGITTSQIESHHTIGIVDQAPLLTAAVGSNSPMSVAQQGVRFSLKTSLSSAPRSTNSSSRLTLGRTLSWLISSLEGEVSQHTSGGVFRFSTAERFAWGIEQPNVSNITFGVYTANGSSPATPKSTLFVSPNSSAIGTTSVESLASQAATKVAQKAASYVSSGYKVIFPSLAIMGPGELMWSGAHENGPPSRDYWTATLGEQYGSAFYAENEQTGDFAHVIMNFNGDSLGGGSGTKAPTLDGGKLESPKADKRQEIDHGVKKTSGDVSYKFKPIISVGGEFPYGLSASVTVNSQKSDFEYIATLTPGGTTGEWSRLQRKYDLDNSGSTNFSSDGLHLLGARTPLEASAAAAAIVALLDISASTEQNAPLINSLIVKWFAKQADENSVRVTSARGSEEFVRQADGNYYAKPGSAETISITPTNTQLVNIEFNNSSCGQSFGGQAATRLPSTTVDWMIDGRVKVISATIVRTLKNGDKETYEPRTYNSSRWNCGPNNPWHPLVKFDNNKGVTVAYAYDSFKQLTKISNNLGRELNFTPSGDPVSGYGVTITDQAGRTASVQESGNKINVTDANNKIWVAELIPAQEAVIDSQGVVTKVPLLGFTLSGIYSPEDNTKPFIKYNYNALWQVASVDSRNRKTGASQYWSNAYQWGLIPGYANVEIDSANAKSSDFFDSRGNLVYQRSPLNLQTLSSYDTWNRLIDKRIYSGSAVLNSIPNAEGLWPINAPAYSAYNGSYLKRSAYLDYDAKSNPQSEKLYPEAGSTSVILNIARTFESFNSKLKTETFRYADNATPVNSVTNKHYASGLLEQSTTAAGLVTKYIYNTKGLPTSITEGSSATVVRKKIFEYDKGTLLYGNLTKFTTTDINETAATSIVVSAEYTTVNDEIRGDIRKITDPRGNATSAIYDNARHITELTGPLSTGTKYDYDDNGRLYQIQNKDGKGNFAITTAALNPLGWMTGLKDPSNNWQYFDYDARGLLRQSQDGRGRLTQYNYNADGKLTCEQNGIGTSLLRSYKILGYNEIGQLSSSNPAKSDTNNDCQTNNTLYQTTLTYDDYGQLETTVFPDGTYEQSTYHPNGSGTVETKRTREGNNISFTYDGANRVYTKIAPGNGTITYNYNVFGLSTDTTQVGGANSVLGFGYDFLGRLTSSTQNGRTVTMDYDKSDNRSYVQWPDGYRVTYGTYDSLNRITTITDSFNKQLASYSYDINYNPAYANGSRTTITYGNNKTSYFDYKPDGNLKALSHNTGASVTYGYVYNAAHQLTSESVSNRSYYWTQKTAGSGYGINNLDQYTNVDTGTGAVTFDYDDNGNLTVSNKGTFDYDAENKLTNAQINASGPQGALSVNYMYDANGRRTEKSITRNGSTVSTKYLSEGDNEIAEYIGSATTPSKRFIYGKNIDEIIAMHDVATNTYSYAHRNHQGSVVAVSDAAGNVSASNIYTYSPYGEPNSAANTGAAGFPYRYTGRRIDPETGLYYYRARYYDSQLGRFLQTDPIGYKDQMNLYAYVHNDPVNHTDPTGMETPDISNGQMPIATEAFTPGGLAVGAMVAVQVIPVANVLANAAMAKRGVDITIKMKNGWSAEQKAQATTKVGHLNSAAARGELKTVRAPERASDSAKSRYERETGSKVESGKDVDHKTDLQLGGSDTVGNMAPLDASVNRSIGAQIQQQIKNLPTGSQVCSVTMTCK